MTSEVNIAVSMEVTDGCAMTDPDRLGTTLARG
jgi:hypothetical protein